MPAGSVNPGMARVCLVTHVVAPWDGQGRVSYQLARHLADWGHGVTLVAATVDPALLERGSIEWLPVPVPGRLPDPVRASIFASRARRMLSERRLAGYDIVHLNGPITPIRSDVNASHFVHASWARLAPKGSRSLYQRMVTAGYAATERRAYRSARRVVAVSDAVRTGLLDDVGVDIEPTVIPNGVDPLEFRPRDYGERTTRREAAAIPGDALLAVFVGDARSSRKNLDLALAAVAAAHDDVHLVVIGDPGDGPYPALAGTLGVKHRVHFLGARHDIADWLRECDVAFSVAHYDPAPLTLLEAMASGLVVIAAPGVGNATFIRSGHNGWLLDSPDDVQNAVRTLRRLHADRDLVTRIGAAARRTAADLTWERMAREYEAVYAQVLSEREGVVPPSPGPDRALSGATAEAS